MPDYRQYRRIYKRILFLPLAARRFCPNKKIDIIETRIIFFSSKPVSYNLTGFLIAEIPDMCVVWKILN